MLARIAKHTGLKPEDLLVGKASQQPVASAGPLRGPPLNKAG